MSSWDTVLPHRMLINNSLRKASEDLRVHIDEYKVQYELEIERCTIEIKQAQAKKENEFELVKASLINELSKDAALFEVVQYELLRYVDLYLQRQCLYRIQEAKYLEKKALDEYKNFLTLQMKYIGDEINVLEERKDKLTAQADISDFRKLILLTDGAIIVNDNDNAISLMEKVSEQINLCDKTELIIKQALRKFRCILQERVDFVQTIQYITWVIKQKKLLSSQLKEEKVTIINELKAKDAELSDIKKSITLLNNNIDESARTVRDYWAKPLLQINIDICDYYTVKDRLHKEASIADTEYNEYSKNLEETKKRIQEIKGTSHSQSEWKSLNDESKNFYDNKCEANERKKSIQEKIDTIKQKIKNLKSERQMWYDRKDMLFSLCEKNTITLKHEGKGEKSDEYRILTSRLTEIDKPKNEFEKSEQERYKRDVEHLEKQRDAGLTQISSKIKLAEKAKNNADSAYNQALEQLSRSKSEDNRFFLLKIVPTEEIKQANKALKMATTHRNNVDDELAKLETQRDRVLYEFKYALSACQPKDYRPSLEEKEARTKLERRISEILESPKQKNAKRKVASYDSKD
jgi:hypothetical protein